MIIKIFCATENRDRFSCSYYISIAYSLKHKMESDLIHVMEWLGQILMVINIGITLFVPFTSYLHNLPSYKNININHNGKSLNIAVANKTESSRFASEVGPTLERDRNVFTIDVAQIRYLQSTLGIPHIKIIYYALVYTELGWHCLQSFEGFADENTQNHV